VSQRPATGREVAELARQKADNLNRIYARVQDGFLRPVALEMVTAIEKFRDLEPGDSVTLSKRAQTETRFCTWPADLRNKGIDFYARPVIISIDAHRCCTLRLPSGQRYEVHAQWLRRVTRDEVEE